MRIIFMGTSDFGIPTLNKLLLNPLYDVVAVYTKAPAISGRGHQIQISPIHEIANNHQLQIFTPKTLRDINQIEEFKKLKPDLAIVISYGLILPAEILNIPAFGCFNIHPSKLPLYRGSAPIQRSIMNGENQSSVCIIKMDSGIDSGDIVNEREFAIDDIDDYKSITTKTAEIGSELILKTLKEIKNLTPIKQDNNLATYAHKIDKSECLINWNQSALKIFNHIRGLNGNLGAYFNYEGEKIKILESDYQENFSDINQKKYANGSVVNEMFFIKCKDGIIMPKILQRQGKKPVKINEFLNGFKPKIGSLCN